MSFLGISLLLLLVPVWATLQIVPGATWTATNTGVHMQAHGAGVIQVGSTYYLIGEDHTNGSAFQNINCYSSTNLVEWTFVNALLTQQPNGDLGPSRVVERPKILYNSNSKQYVMWMHIDNSTYGEAKVGVATSNTVCGAYNYRGSFQPLGYQSRDMGLFQDDDGSAYLLSEDRANGLRIDQLSSDYLSVASSTYLWPDHIEAPAMLKKNGVYFMFGSHLSGWSPNDNVYSTATNIAGPWSSWQTFAQTGTNTYDSQTNYILQVGSNTIYMGDRWISTNLMASTYIWLPLNISGSTASMSNYVNWVPSTFSAGPSETQDEGENASLSNGAKVVSCSGCSGGEAAGWIGGPSKGAAYFSSVQSSATTRTTIRINFENGDTTQRFASVSINGGSAQRVAFLPSPDGQTPADSVLTANLNAGTNTIKISGLGDGSYGPDIDVLRVPIN